MNKLNQNKGNIGRKSSGGRGSAGSRVRRGRSCLNVNELIAVFLCCFFPLVKAVSEETQLSVPSRQSSRDRKPPNLVSSGEFVVADAASRLRRTQIFVLFDVRSKRLSCRVRR